jgi:hypothetical protein
VGTAAFPPQTFPFRSGSTALSRRSGKVFMFIYCRHHLIGITLFKQSRKEISPQFNPKQPFASICEGSHMSPIAMSSFKLFNK